MPDMNRRQFASALTAAGLAPAVAPAPARLNPGRFVRDVPPDATRVLARYVVAARHERS